MMGGERGDILGGEEGRETAIGIEKQYKTINAKQQKNSLKNAKVNLP